MTTKEKEILSFIRDQAGRSSHTRVNTDLIALITNIPKRTVYRALNKLEDAGYIRRETTYVRWCGSPVAHRDIVITDPDDKYRGYTIQEHKNLSQRRNHMCKTYGVYGAKGTTYEWWICPSGICNTNPTDVYNQHNADSNQWLVSMQLKEFNDCREVWEYADASISIHRQYL